MLNKTSIISPSRSDKEIQQKFTDLTAGLERACGVRIDLDTFRTQIYNIVADKMDEYIYNQIRDWQINDLLILAAMAEHKIELDKAPPPAPTQQEKPKRKRNRKKEH